MEGGRPISVLVCSTRAENRFGGDLHGGGGSRGEADEELASMGFLSFHFLRPLAKEESLKNKRPLFFSVFPCFSVFKVGFAETQVRLQRRDDEGREGRYGDYLVS